MADSASMQDVQKENFGKLRNIFHCAINPGAKVNAYVHRLSAQAHNFHALEPKK
jgi:hypothetical protein